MNPARQRICIIGAAFATDNLGVSVLAAGALRFAARLYPNAEITQLDYGRESHWFDFENNGNRVRVRFTNIRFSWRLYLWRNVTTLLLLAMLIRIVPPLRRFLCERNEALRSVVDADLILSLAGGDSFSDIYGMRRLLYVFLPQLLAILARRPLVLLPQTLGPFSRPLSRSVARFVLLRAHRIFVRDAGSHSVARNLLRSQRDARLQLSYDLGFDVDAQPLSNGRFQDPREGGESCLVGVNVSGLLLMGGYNRSNMFGLQCNYEAFTKRMIRRFVENGCHVVLIPHVLGSSPESDTAACQFILDALGHDYPGQITVAPSSLTYAETKHLIGLCDFFAGARMHACIAALSQHVPSACLAYSDKFIGVLAPVGCRDAVVDLRSTDEDQGLEAVSQAFRNRHLLRESLERRMPAVKKRIRELHVRLSEQASMPAVNGVRVEWPRQQKA